MGCGVQALFCQVPPSHVLNMHDVSNIWQVPIVMADQNAHNTICDHLQLAHAKPLNLMEWKAHLADRWDNLTEVTPPPPSAHCKF